MGPALMAYLRLAELVVGMSITGWIVNVKPFQARSVVF